MKLKKFIKIRQIDTYKEINAPKVIFLNAVLMDNGEVICAGKTIGYVNRDIPERFIFNPII